MGIFDRFEKKEHGGEYAVDEDVPTYYPDEDQGHAVVTDNADGLHRKLGNRQIQLIAIGGSIGTALFVSIGTALHKGGPASVLIAYTLHSIMLGLVNNGVAEMTILHPVSGGFIRQSGKWVDEAWGFMAGWNFYLYEALLIPFEITALNLVLLFWRDDIPVAAVCVVVIILYGLINVLAVKAYGEAEFYLSGGKVILIFMLFFFTFITMLGGNPKHDRYGFRNWETDGAFAPYLTTGSFGKFQGFLAALWAASFCVVGPEYVSMVAAEAKRPRIYIKSAFKTMYYRFGIFFIGGALAVGIVLRWKDPTLSAVIDDPKLSSTAAASPYVIAMQNLGISVFPDIVNALMITSIFSAGNTYTYCATRNLYGLSLEGRAPKFLQKTTRNGVPIYCFAITMIFPFLSFLQVSKGSNKVLQIIVNLVTAGGLINYVVMCVTFLFFYRACKAQGLDRKSLPYYGWGQPYCAIIGLIWMSLVVLFFGYSTFLNGNRSPTDTFLTSFFEYYTLLILAPILFVFWKVLKRTKFVHPLECDLVWETPQIDRYEASFISEPVGFWREMLQLFGIGRVKGGNDVRRTSVAGGRTASV